jgi:general secretion pathway protein G
LTAQNDKNPLEFDSVHLIESTMFISRWLGQKPVVKARSLRLRPAGDAGFTLIEIMVVIAIIGILATLIVPKIMGKPDEARAIAAKQDVSTLVQAFKLYRLDIGRYPTTEQGIRALVEKPTSEPVPQNWKAGGYLDSIPKDPWGNPYQYSNPGTRGEIDVYSFGADGKAGGIDNDADIGNWR